MKEIFRVLHWLLAAILVLPMLCGCEQEDDVIDIFTGKMWKLTYIYMEGNYATPLDQWDGDEEAMKASMELAKKAGNFTLEFNGGRLNTGGLGGTFTGRAVNATIQGHWQADGKSRALQFSDVRYEGKETDLYAKAFLSGLSANMTHYSGDSKNLYLHYKEGQLMKVIGLINH